MEKIRNFEELRVWQEARKLVKDIYEHCKTIKDYGFNDQIQRAAVSIMNNIAEGHESGSTPMFKKFLLIAKGSCGEVRSMLYIAIDLIYVKEENALKLINTCKGLSAGITKLISTLKPYL